MKKFLRIQELDFEYTRMKWKQELQKRGIWRKKEGMNEGIAMESEKEELSVRWSESQEVF